MSRAKKFLVFGFYGGWNAGDEAIAYSLVSMLRERSPGCDVLVACTGLREGADDWYRSFDARVVGLRNVTTLLGALATRRLIIGGGQMIAGDRSVKGLLLCLVMLAINRLCLRGPVMIGIGAEGVSRRRAKLLVRLIGAAACRLACRDQYSVDQVSRAGCPARKIELLADLVLGGEVDRLMPREAPPPIQPRPILLVLHDSPVRSYGRRDAYQTLIADVRRAAPDRSVSVVSHDCRPRFDAGLLDELRGSNQDDRVRFVPFDDPRQVLAEYAGAALVLSVRMHPLILATVHGVPWIALGGSNKVRELVARFGAPHAVGLDAAGALVAPALAAGPIPRERVDAARELAWKCVDLAIGA